MQKSKSGSDEMKHGTTALYKKGCRCAYCRRAVAKAQRERIAHFRANPQLIPAGIHGRHTTYMNYACRCAECRKAWSEEVARQQASRKRREPPVGSHGRESTYVNWGCRCDECRAAHAATARNRYRRNKEQVSA